MFVLASKFPLLSSAQCSAGVTGQQSVDRQRRMHTTDPCTGQCKPKLVLLWFRKIKSRTKSTWMNIWLPRRIVCLLTLGLLAKQTQLVFGHDDVMLNVLVEADWQFITDCEQKRIFHNNEHGNATHAPWVHTTDDVTMVKMGKQGKQDHQLQTFGTFCGLGLKCLMRMTLSNWPTEGHQKQHW